MLWAMFLLRSERASEREREREREREMRSPWFEPQD